MLGDVRAKRLTCRHVVAVVEMGCFVPWFITNCVGHGKG
jgi:hypothetical protein